MDLEQLRKEIDTIDNDILSAFEKRMDLCRQVALYKIENNLPVFHPGREQVIIDKVRDKSPEHLKDASAVLFTEIMDISKSLQQAEFFRNKELTAPSALCIEKSCTVGCQGTSGSNSEVAARKLFPENDITFYHNFLL